MAISPEKYSAKVCLTHDALLVLIYVQCFNSKFDSVSSSVQVAWRKFCKPW